jgi:hypothetical protein
MHCARCGALQPDYLIFQTGWPPVGGNVRYWCLNHRPWWSKLSAVWGRLATRLSLRHG